MTCNIALNFEIIAYERCFEKYTTYSCNKFYNVDCTFSDILLDLYKAYSKYSSERDTIDSISASISNDNLFEINYNFKDIYPEYGFDDYRDVSIGKLEEMFSISKAIFNVVLDLEVGATVGEYNGIKFIVHTSNEKDKHSNIPHVHCRYSGEEFVVELNTLKIVGREFKTKAKTYLALDLIEKNKEGLIRCWNDVVVNGRPVVFKMLF